VPIVPNNTKRKLADGELALGFGATLLRGSSPSLLARTGGFDWLFIDMEHAATTVDDASRMAAAALATGVTPLVRCQRAALHEATRVLDNGAQGVVVPHIDTVADAREMVETFLYPPRGHRSITNQIPQAGYALPFHDDDAFRAAIEELNRQTLLIAMIESPEAVANADAIAAVDGIDVLLIGANDLAASMNLHNKAGHPKVREAFVAVADAANRNGKFWGFGGVFQEEVARSYYELNARLILATDDFGAILAGSAPRVAFFRALAT
jgi:2-keto-3-deoxy-L-rhamnonate aldolase RhmA